MRSCLFDTNAVSLMFANLTPEKWIRYWKDVRDGRRTLILFEPLVSEVFYQSVKKFGLSEAKKKVMWLKSLPHVDIHSLTDVDAFDAGELKLRYNNLSMVDSFMLSIGKRQGSLILTTDHDIRDAGRKMNIEIDFLPFPHQ